MFVAADLKSVQFCINILWLWSGFFLRSDVFNVLILQVWSALTTTQEKTLVDCLVVFLLPICYCGVCNNEKPSHSSGMFIHRFLVGHIHVLANDLIFSKSLCILLMSTKMLALWCCVVILTSMLSSVKIIY